MTESAEVTSTPTTAVAALAAAIDAVGVADASEHIRSADNLAPSLLSHLDALGWRLVRAETDPADEPWTHGSRYGRAHRSIRQHLVEDHGFDWPTVAAMSDGAVHGWHDAEHGQTWAYAKDLPHPQAGDGCPPTPPTVADAAALAAGAHRGVVDKAGRPYIEHPARVAAMLAENGDHAATAGWLHDVVEDSDVTCADLLAAGYPPEVVAAVDAVTRQDGESYWAMIERARQDTLGRLVKLADNADNSDEARLALLPSDDAKRLRRKYLRARLVLTAPEQATT
ncbi:HD domain-containing protein [Micromonospora sp. WMMD737]|uniref:HD domain-containing protein n=1 Tax=Micromonospora sp. WMMD737 TaxID=3404113 RepID=UPI003B937CCA